MTAEQNTTLNTITGALGVKSKAALAQYSPAEIDLRMRDAKQECSWSGLQELHAEAKKEYDDLRIMEKNILTRASPLLPQAVKLGLKHPGVSLQDYEEWFGWHAAQYASPGDVSSMFSPAAYLTALYREARELYSATSVWHIDQRRPDLKDLVLSQKNMDTEVSALSLSNEILLERTREAMKPPEGGETPTENAALEVLSGHVTSSGTPYHRHYSRLRQARFQKDPAFKQLQSAPAVTKHLSGPALAAMYYDIPPALYRLLTDEIPADEELAKEKFKAYFGNMPAEMLMQPLVLRQWFGLTDDELMSFIPLNEYVDNVLVSLTPEGVTRVVMNSPSESKGFLHFVRIYPQTSTLWRAVYSLKTDSVFGAYLNIPAEPESGNEFASPKWLAPNIPIHAGELVIRDMDISTAFYDHPENNPPKAKRFLANYSETENNKMNYIWVACHKAGEAQGGTNEKVFFTLTTLPTTQFLLKLNKAIRLYKATGLSPRVLEDIVNSVNPDQITDDTLTLLFRTHLLMQRYGISHEDALVMAKGRISMVEHGNEPSHFDRLFNLPSRSKGDFYPEIKPHIFLLPEKAEDDWEIKAVLKRAFQTDDIGLAALWQVYASNSTGHQFYLSLKDISGMYAISLWARLHGLTPQSLLSLLTLMGLPNQLWNAQVGVWNELLEKLHSVVNWLNARNWTVHDLHIMTRDVTTIPASTEITNFIEQVRAVVAGSELPEKPVLNDYMQALNPLVTATFSLNSETAGAALLNWVNQAEPEGLDVAGFWAALTEPTALKKKKQQNLQVSLLLLMLWRRWR